MTTYIDADLGWEVVEHCRTAMRIPELNAVFVALGAGDYHAAIVASIVAADREDLPLPAELHRRLRQWSDLIVDAGRRERLTALMAPSPGRLETPHTAPETNPLLGRTRPVRQSLRSARHR